MEKFYKAEIETAEEIRDRMRGRIDSKYNSSLGSFFSDAVSPMAIELEHKNGEIAEIIRMQDIAFQFGEGLSRTVFQRTGINRRVAVPAEVELVFIGTPSTEVPKGTIISSDTVSYKTVDDCIIGAESQGKVLAVATEAGSKGNLPANMITVLPVTLRGITSVTNLTAAHGGYDEETDEELLERYFERMQTPGKGGNVYHYRDWAKEVSGVGGVFVTPLWNGDLTVKVNITDYDGLPAGEELVEEVRQHIEEEKPFGAYVTVAPAEELDLNISVKLKYIKGLDELEKTAVQEDLKESVTEYLGMLAFKEKEVSAAKIGCLLLKNESIEDYADLDLNGAGMKNVTTADRQVAVLKDFTASEVI